LFSRTFYSKVQQPFLGSVAGRDGERRRGGTSVTRNTDIDTSSPYTGTNKKMAGITAGHFHNKD